ncbi:MAG: phosphatidylglycerophosphatase A [Candidatus Omnitrophica bacterium]|nr:phosphatidylglycerophosphatase A [Candidatus Omnitrophota bacterium]
MNFVIKKMIKFLATFFFIGFLPIMPGTYASIAAAAVYFLLHDSAVLFRLLTVMVGFAGFFVCGKAEEIFHEKDSSRIVIDEVFFFFLYYWLFEFSWIYLIAVVILFRFFDIIKPYPIKAVQKLHGSLGIMLDDVIACIYAAGCFYLIAQLRLFE